MKLRDCKGGDVVTPSVVSVDPWASRKTESLNLGGRGGLGVLGFRDHFQSKETLNHTGLSPKQLIPYAHLSRVPANVRSQRAHVWNSYGCLTAVGDREPSRNRCAN